MQHMDTSTARLAAELRKSRDLQVRAVPVSVSRTEASRLASSTTGGSWDATGSWVRRRTVNTISSCPFAEAAALDKGADGGAELPAQHNSI